jgi:hypothetical protein
MEADHLIASMGMGATLELAFDQVHLFTRSQVTSLCARLGEVGHAADRLRLVRLLARFEEVNKSPWWFPAGEEGRAGAFCTMPLALVNVTEHLLDADGLLRLATSVAPMQPALRACSLESERRRVVGISGGPVLAGGSCAWAGRFALTAHGMANNPSQWADVDIFATTCTPHFLLDLQPRRMDKLEPGQQVHRPLNMWCAGRAEHDLRVQVVPVEAEGVEAVLGSFDLTYAQSAIWLSKQGQVVCVASASAVVAWLDRRTRFVLGARQRKFRILKAVVGLGYSLACRDFTDLHDHELFSKEKEYEEEERGNSLASFHATATATASEPRTLTLEGPFDETRVDELARVVTILFDPKPLLLRKLSGLGWYRSFDHPPWPERRIFLARDVPLLGEEEAMGRLAGMVFPEPFHRMSETHFFPFVEIVGPCAFELVVYVPCVKDPGLLEMLNSPRPALCGQKMVHSLQRAYGPLNPQRPICPFLDLKHWDCEHLWTLKMAIPKDLRNWCEDQRRRTGFRNGFPMTITWTGFSFNSETGVMEPIVSGVQVEDVGCAARFADMSPCRIAFMCAVVMKVLLLHFAYRDDKAAAP